MAETQQIGFDLREAAIALVRHHGLHEGRWMLALEFNLAAGNFGSDARDAKPGAIVQINKFILARQPAEAPDMGAIVDAAEVNPAPSASNDTDRKSAASKKR
jgi:hypothetical protein